MTMWDRERETDGAQGRASTRSILIVVILTAAAGFTVGAVSDFGTGALASAFAVLTGAAGFWEGTRR